ncbi:MAG: HAD family hydrolase [Anaerolineae bacterium]|jgi:sugar-phosphatase
MTQIACQAILFDLDGVLIDSTRCITRHWQAWARQHGLEITAVMQAAHGLRTVETMRRFAPHLDVEREAERFTAMEVADTQGVVAVEGASEMLKGLPDGAWAIVTSGSRDLARSRLRRAGLPVSGTLVGGDDVRQGKPAPEPYLVGAKRLGQAAERCVVIEDAPAGVEAARAAGMQVIGITTTHSREQLGCAVVVERLSAVRILVGEGGRLLVRTA